MCLRVSFGLSLVCVGLVHYMTLGAFVGMASEGLGPLSGLGVIWAYILPALMIVGGALLAIGMYTLYAAWAVGVALGSIPVGMLAQSVLSGADLPSMMGMANNAFIWLLVFYFVVKCSSCCGSSCDSGEKK